MTKNRNAWLNKKCHLSLNDKSINQNIINYIYITITTFTWSLLKVTRPSEKHRKAV